MTVRIAVLASGNGSNLQAIVDAVADGTLAAEVVVVVTNVPGATALQRAASAGVPTIELPRWPGEDRSDYDTRLADAVAVFEPDWVVLAGWMRILTMAFLGRFRRQVVNLHPALPGELAGIGSIERAYDQFVAGTRRQTGVMVHLVPDEGVDDGPVLAAEVVPIDADDTLDDLAAKVHVVEHALLVATLVRLVSFGLPHSIQPEQRPPLPKERTVTNDVHDPRRDAEQRDGRLNATLFDRFEALTFDDVVVVPGYSEVLPGEVDVRARFAADIVLNVPILSAAMDKVTESAMAIAMAREGGIGVVHRNLTIEDQATEVERVKRSQSGMITDPVTLRPDATLADAELLMAKFHISGVPITDETNRLVGILTNRDTRFTTLAERARSVADFMTADGLVTAPVGTSLEGAKALLQRHRIEKLPLVDDAGHLIGLITVKDIVKHESHPNAVLDGRGRLRVAAAVGVGDDLEARVAALVAAGVDAVAIDTAHGHSAGVVKAIQRIKGAWPHLPVVAGNVVTAEGVEALADAGADAVKVGVGAGSICTTRVVSGAGMPQLSAVFEAAAAARRRDIPLIADGGITYSGDVVKAVVAGADTVMLGSGLAGTDEAPGELELFEGRRYKSYRGMGSLGAMQGLGADRYGTRQGAPGTGTRKLVPEGVEGRVPYAGRLRDVVEQLVGGLRSGMGYAGAASLADLRANARLMRVTTAGREESHPHDVQITKEAPNYQRNG